MWCKCLVAGGKHNITIGDEVRVEHDLEAVAFLVNDEVEPRFQEKVLRKKELLPLASFTHPASIQLVPQANVG